jgi:hypothetical protein
MTALASFKSEIMAITVCAAACSVGTFDYAVRVEPLVQGERIAQHARIINATAAAPDRYRILVPYLLQPFIAFARTVGDPSSALTRVYDLHYLGSLTLLRTLFR